MNLPSNLQNIIRMQYLTGVNGNKNIPNKNEVSANQIIVAYTTNTNEYQNFGHFSTSGSSFFAVLPINLLYFFLNRSVFERWNWNTNSQEIQSNRTDRFIYMY